jgi:hypothetical protein
MKPCACTCAPFLFVGLLSLAWASPFQNRLVRGENDAGAKHGKTPALTDPHRTAERRAYVTLVTTSNYAIGALVLARCLRRTGTPYPLVALIGELVPEAVRLQLENEGIQVVGIQESVKSPPIQVQFNLLCRYITPCPSGPGSLYSYS